MMKVLVIEDEANLRKNISEILTWAGYEVQTALNGSDGLEVLKTFTPDAIVCDIMMPVMDGYTFTRKFRLLPGNKDIALIILTAKGDREDMRMAMENGADDFITKPFSKEELLSAIQSRLNRLRHFDFEGEGGTKPVIRTEELTAAIQLLSQLSPAEKKVIALVGLGMTSRQIGEQLFISGKTVENHRTNISRKLGLKGPNSLLTVAIGMKKLGHI
jgi:DNA-binding NarL/FixJ family response regulator